LAKGTTTVKVDGGQMAANKGSELSRSTGDEAGTAGGVTSSTFIKEATWMLYSEDVFLEGKNACRLTDKVFMNHQNTVCLAGWLEVYNSINKKKRPDECTFLREWIDARVNAEGKDNITSDRGLNERFRQNTEGGRLGARGHPDYPRQWSMDSPTGGTRIGVGMNEWDTHNEEIQKTQNALKEEIKEYEKRGCGYEGSARKMTKAEQRFIEEAKEASNRSLPTRTDWTGPPLA